MIHEKMNDFIVIDDDPINNMICFKIIELTIPGCDVRTFTNPEKGLDHIRRNYPTKNEKGTILFLDINMPGITGWNVLEKIETFAAAAKDMISIYMLSSSVDLSDKEKADNHPMVNGYITKPLSKAKLLHLLATTS